MIRFFFSIIFIPIGFIIFIIGGSTYLALSIFIPPKHLHPLVRIICRLFLLGSGQWLKVEGKPPDVKSGPYLYLFNHESLFDAFMIMATIPHYVTSVGANKQFSWPLWGRIVKQYGIISIKRKNIEEAIHSLDRLEDAIRDGVSCIISPEGTRTLTGKMGPFKKGPFHVALNTGVTIIPIGIIGAFKAKSKNDWRIKPGILTLKFGNPIFHDNFKAMSVEEIRDIVRENIAKLCVG